MSLSLSPEWSPMNNTFESLFQSLLAQSAPPFEGGATETAARTAANGSTSGMDIQVLLIAGVILFLLMTVLGGRREKKKFDQMLSGIKKNDSVRTVGGTIGTVVEVKPDVVVLKIDEHSNTKMTVARGKIEAVLKESTASDTTTAS